MSKSLTETVTEKIIAGLLLFGLTAYVNWVSGKVEKLSGEVGVLKQANVGYTKDITHIKDDIKEVNSKLKSNGEAVGENAKKLDRISMKLKIKEYDR